METIDVDGLTAAYADEGSGAAVILTHCSSSTHQMWAALTEELKKTHRVIAPDLFGYGTSTRWPDSRAFRIGADAAILTALAGMVDGPVHLVGHSYGGAVTLEAALQLGPKLAGMTLIEPVAFRLLSAAGRAAEWRRIETLVGEVETAMQRGDPEAAAAAYMGFWLGLEAWAQAPERFRQGVLDTIDKVRLEFQSVHKTSSVSLEGLAEIAVPTLLIYGTQTQPAAKHVIDILANMLPNSEVRALEGAGHMSPMSHRDEVNALILGHVERRGPSAPD